MNNFSGKAMLFWKDMAAENPAKTSVRLNAANDMSRYDADFISRFIEKNCAGNCRMLDLGSGTGLILDKISAPVELITAVEPFSDFTRHIEPRPYLEIVNAAIQDFVPKIQYNLASFFGVMQYFSACEAAEVYKKYAEYLATDGFIIVKNQFSINEDLLVDGYSEQLGKNYYSQYRTLEHEKKLLAGAGLDNITAYDIYPSECNHWDNTHYYALTAQKTGHNIR